MGTQDDDLYKGKTNGFLANFRNKKSNFLFFEKMIISNIFRQFRNVCKRLEKIQFNNIWKLLNLFWKIFEMFNFENVREVSNPTLKSFDPKVGKVRNPCLKMVEKCPILNLDSKFVSKNVFHVFIKQKWAMVFTDED